MNSSHHPRRILPPMLLLILCILPQCAIGRISNSLHVENEIGRSLLDQDDYVSDVTELTDGSENQYDSGNNAEVQSLLLEKDEMPHKSMNEEPIISAGVNQSQTESGTNQEMPAKPPVWPDDDDDDDFADKKAALDKGIVFVHDENGEGGSPEMEKKPSGYESDTKVVSSEGAGGEGQDGMEEGGGTTTENEVESGVGADSIASPSTSEQEKSAGSTFEEEIIPEESVAIGTEAGTQDETATNPPDDIDSSEKSDNLLPLEESIPTSTIAIRNQEEVTAGEGSEGETIQSAPEIAQVTEETINETPPENAVSIPEENATNPNSQLCAPATNCMDCINLSFNHLQRNMEPCYWTNQCLSAGEMINTDNPPSTAYKCAEDGSAIYTGDAWEVALNALNAASESPGGKSESNPPMGNQGYDYYDDEDEGLFEMIKSTFNVVLLAAVIASILVIRKRVMNRLRDDPSLEMADVVKEEVVGCVVSIGSWVANRVGGSRDGGINHEYRPVTMGSRTNSFERQTIPLSTAADEEWGWGDEDASTNVELPAVGGDDAKEEEDLALAIAMSLSESTNGGSTAAAQPKTNNIPKPTPKPSASKPKATTSFQSRLKDKKSPKAAPKPTASAAAVPPPPSTGDSIEDLLGQMSTGGNVITSFGQKPQTASKPKPLPPKKQDSDDLFASMGLSTYSSKPASSTAPKSAPLPSAALAADNDDDADWGDDEDLDDLLDD